MAEAEDLKSSQCGFDPHSGHQSELTFGLAILLTARSVVVAIPRATSPLYTLNGCQNRTFISTILAL